MPTRAAAAAAATANMRTTRSRNMSNHSSGKENGTPSLPSTTKGKEKEKPAPKKPVRNVKAKAKKVEEVFCSCRGVDDGTPMVQCGTCSEWLAPVPLPLFPFHFTFIRSTDPYPRYHFRCVELTEDDAGEISESTRIPSQLSPAPPSD
jgi:hypothetical protein